MTAAQRLQPLTCQRPGCPHRYGLHAPGGGNCMVWDPDTGEHCPCVGFRWVSLTEGPASHHWRPRPS